MALTILSFRHQQPDDEPVSAITSTSSIHRKSTSNCAKIALHTPHIISKLATHQHAISSSDKFTKLPSQVNISRLVARRCCIRPCRLNLPAMCRQPRHILMTCTEGSDAYNRHFHALSCPPFQRWNDGSTFGNQNPIPDRHDSDYKKKLREIRLAPSLVVCSVRTAKIGTPGRSMVDPRGFGVLHSRRRLFDECICFEKTHRVAMDTAPARAHLYSAVIRKLYSGMRPSAEYRAMPRSGPVER